jgi:hypothetical protein
MEKYAELFAQGKPIHPVQFGITKEGEKKISTGRQHCYLGLVST